MRDHNTVTLSGVLTEPPEPFKDFTLRGCSFVLCSHAEWKKATTNEIEDRFDEIPVRAHGPVCARALRLQPQSHVLITAEIRMDTAGHIYLNAKTIQLLTNIESGK